MASIKQRVAALEGGGTQPSLGALLDALDDPIAFAKVQISPALAAALARLEVAEPGQVTTRRYGDMPL